jgi:hypothetical protein
MAVSVMTLDRMVLGPIVTNAAGVAVFNVPCPTPDRIYRLNVNRVYGVLASGGHLLTAGTWICEFVMANKGGITFTIAAVSGSFNPFEFAGFIPYRVEASDVNFSFTTGNWTTDATTNAVLTVTVLNALSVGQPGVSVFAVVDVESCGAT